MLDWMMIGYVLDVQMGVLIDWVRDESSLARLQEGGGDARKCVAMIRLR